MWKLHLDSCVWAKSYNSLQEMEAERKWYFRLEMVSMTCCLSSLTHCQNSVMVMKMCFTKTYDTTYSTGMTIIGSLQMAMLNVWWKYSLLCFNVLSSLTNFLSIHDLSKEFYCFLFLCSVLVARDLELATSGIWIMRNYCLQLCIRTDLQNL